MNLAAGAAFVLLMLAIARIIFTGSAMAGDGGFNREDEPATYWAILGAASILALVFLGFAIFG